MENRFKSLDGWRGISILFVLLGHWFPLGQKAWGMNGAIAATGMAIFFILSGFLITNILLRNQNIKHFLIRRFLRIIPLAWLIMLITLLAISASWQVYLPHFLFFANWPPMQITEPTSHLWSLCVEMQFYVLIALLVLFLKKRAFFLLPLLCLIVTTFRYVNNIDMAIDTYYRIDEILAGCILALVCNQPNDKLRVFISMLNPLLILPLLIVSAHPASGFMNYLRPYIALALVGSTLFNKEDNWFLDILKGRVLFYIASISYALYVLHGGLAHSWLGQGEGLAKYIKRPLLLAVTFGLAHLSTFYYEKYWITLGKKLTTNKSKE